MCQTEVGDKHESGLSSQGGESEVYACAGRQVSWGEVKHTSTLVFAAICLFGLADFQLHWGN